MKKVVAWILIMIVTSSLFACDLTKEEEKKIDVKTNTIEEVLSASSGESYQVNGTVIGITNNGLLVEDESGIIYVHLLSKTTVSRGDLVKVSGTTEENEGNIQFSSDTLVTFVESGSYEETRTVKTFTSLEESGFAGNYLEMNGSLIENGDFYEVDLEGSDVFLALEGDISSFDTSAQDLIFTGYFLYVTIADINYIHFLVTDIREESDRSDDIDVVTILEVLEGEPGLNVTTEGVIASLSTTGILITRQDSYLFIYTGSMERKLVLDVGDTIQVDGEISLYGGATQLQASTIRLISDDTFIEARQASVLSASDINLYETTISAGDYIEVSGTIKVEAGYLNLIVDGSNMVLSLQDTKSSFFWESYHDKECTITGYTLYVSGSSTKYFNIMVTDVVMNSSIDDDNPDQGDNTDPNDIIDISILTMNDLHGYILRDDDGTSGISNMAYLINDIRANNDNVFLFGNGDMFQGTAISNMTHGLAIIEVMNLMGFDAMGVGNHEFDWGIDLVLDYFDNDVSNGEADFPLLNANVHLKSDDSLLTVIEGQVYEYMIIDQGDIQIGVISYVGDIINSISQDKVADYYFDLEILASVEDIATSMKNDGADLVLMNIHDYDSNLNSDIATLQDDEGNYLVDLIMTGHTHSYKEVTLSRPNGSPLLIIQAGANGNSFGRIDFSYDLTNNEIKSYSMDTVSVSSAGTNYDETVESYIESVIAELDNTVLATAGDTIMQKSDLFTWTANVVLEATEADIVFQNDGGVRSTGGIIEGEAVTVAQLYEISPFDNTIWTMQLTKSEFQYLLNNNALYYEVKDGISLNNQDTYTVAVISYVYYWDSVAALHSTDDINTELYIRDLLIEDITIKGENNELFSPITHPEASITSQLDPYLDNSSESLAVK